MAIDKVAQDANVNVVNGLMLLPLLVDGWSRRRSSTYILIQGAAGANTNREDSRSHC